jgi:hypothetical protein
MISVGEIGRSGMGASDGAKRRVRHLLRAPFVVRARMRDRRAVASCRYKLAVCAIFREEAPFLAEWIDFHCMVGVGHFYLYDNFSTDDFRAVLEPYIRSGLVTLTDWPVPVGQLPAYRDCLRRHWRDAQWIALIDVDEYLFSPLARDVTGIFDRYRDLPGLCVWQAFFGSAGHQDRPDGPIVEAYTMRAALSLTTVKTIVNPRMVYKAGVHTSKFWTGEGLDTGRRRIEKDMEPALDVLRINHYWSRSLADLDQKIRRGDASTAALRDRDWHFAFEKKMNEVRDETILHIGRAAPA